MTKSRLVWYLLIFLPILFKYRATFLAKSYLNTAPKNGLSSEYRAKVGRALFKLLGIVITAISAFAKLE